MVVVHGFLGSGRNLASLARRLVAAHPQAVVILPDLRGHGASPLLLPQSSLETLAEDILELGEHVAGLQPMHLIGHSLGGRVAMATLGLAPNRLASVAVLDIGPSPVRSLGGGLQQVLERLMQAPAQCDSRGSMRAFFVNSGVTAALADWIVMNGRVEEGQFVWRIDRQALLDLHQRSSAQDLWPVLETQLRASIALPPVTVVRGGASSYVSDVDLARLQALGWRTATLPGAGHFVHVDAPEALMTWLP